MEGVGIEGFEGMEEVGQSIAAALSVGLCSTLLNHSYAQVPVPRSTSSYG